MGCEGSRVQISQLQAFNNGVLDLDYSAIKGGSPDDPSTAPFQGIWA